jgi:hypothetical protein
VQIFGHRALGITEMINEVPDLLLLLWTGKGASASSIERIKNTLPW